MKPILAVLAGGLLIGAFSGANAELPPLTNQEKVGAAAKLEKATAEKARAATSLARAQDRAVANYRMNKASSSVGTMTQPKAPHGTAAAAAPAQGADHSRAGRPDAELSRREAQTEMPKPGQANDHSTTARDPRNSSGR